MDHETRRQSDRIAPSCHIDPKAPLLRADPRQPIRLKQIRSLDLATILQTSA
jgi:hypothetical protein